MAFFEQKMRVAIEHYDCYTKIADFLLSLPRCGLKAQVHSSSGPTCTCIRELRLSRHGRHEGEPARHALYQAWKTQMPSSGRCRGATRAAIEQPPPDLPIAVNLLLL